MKEEKNVTVSVFVKEQTRRELKAHATLLGLTVSEYMTKLYELDRKENLIKKVIHKDCRPVSLNTHRQGESRCL